MKHEHYDLDQIEAGIRAMYQSLPETENPIHKLTRSQVDLLVAFERFKYGAFNNGADTNAVIHSLLGFMGDRINDMAISVSSCCDNCRIDTQEAMISDVIEHINMINETIAKGGQATGKMAVNSATCGTA